MDSNPAQTNPLAVALAAAHAELRNPAKDAINPHFRSRYATLDALQDASRTILAKYGLTVTQVCQSHSEVKDLSSIIWELKTILMHESGVSVESRMPLIAVTKGPQAFGSELTYMRRYALAAILNMAGEEDDDANEAQNKTETKKKTSPPKSDDILGPDEEDPDWSPKSPKSPKTQIRPTLEKGPVDTDPGPDEIPGLESAAQVAREVLGAEKLEEMTLLEQVQAVLAFDGISEGQLMTLIRSYKLTRATSLSFVDNKVLSTIVDKWPAISKKLKEKVSS